MLALDTEDDSQGTVKIINFYDGKRHTTFTGKNMRWNAQNWLNRQGRVNVWCCNTEYDLINLYGSEWLGKLVTLQYVGAGFMRAFARESPVLFLDTLRHWPRSVKQMGEFIGLPKMELDPDSIEYCQRDTEITWKFVNHMLKRYDMLGLSLRATLPGMAMQLFQKFYVDDFPKLPEDLLAKFRQAYYGGRVEIYQMGLIQNSINHYDINSLFPSVMLGGKYPTLTSWRRTRKPDFSKEGVVIGHVQVPNIYYPCLPVRTSLEIMFPYGNFHGAWTYPEIRQLLQDGGKIEPLEAIEFNQTESPFDDYVEFCYRKRLESTHELDKLLWKLFLNSLYGKFGQHKGIISIHWSKEQRKVVQTEIGGSSKQSNVIWSAYVTAYARLKLLHWLRSCTKVYYTDTDSLFTPDYLPISPDLGGMKQEGTYKSAEFVGSKLYVIDDKAKAKGVKEAVAKDFIRTGRAVYRRPARFRESMKTFAKANVWYDVEKRLTKRYTKRKVIAGGETEPWNYREYKSWIKKRGAVKDAGQLNLSL